MNVKVFIPNKGLKVYGRYIYMDYIEMIMENAFIHYDTIESFNEKGERNILNRFRGCIGEILDQNIIEL